MHSVWLILAFVIFFRLTSAFSTLNELNEITHENDRQEVCDEFDSYFCTVTYEEDMQLVRKYFQKTKPKSGLMVSLTFETITSIPANVLSSFAAQEIVLTSTVMPTDAVDIHEDAFRASQHTAEIVYINYMSLLRSNFSFLDNFTALRSLYLFNTNLSGFRPTTFLPTVTYIKIYNCYDFNRWPFSPSQTPQLANVEVKPQSDDLMSELFDSMPKGVTLQFLS